MMITRTTIGAVPAEAADRPAALAAVLTPLLRQPRHGPWIGMPIEPLRQRKAKAAEPGIGR